MIEFFCTYRYLIVPFCIWFGIQLFKVIYDFFENKKWNWSRLMGAGGMPSSHSAVVVSLATLIGKYEGVQSPLFALSVIFAFITMYDAAGVRRAVGKQAHILNQLTREKYKDMSFGEILQEKTGHTPFQVLAGALIGLAVGLIF